MKHELTKQEQAITALLEAPCAHMALTPAYACIACCRAVVVSYAAQAVAREQQRAVAAVQSVGEPGEPTDDTARKLAALPIKALAHLTNIAVQQTKEEAVAAITKGTPAWCCAGCGSVGPFRNVTHETPGEPDDYDMECVACGSLEICESIAEAFQRHDELQEAHEVQARETFDAVGSSPVEDRNDIDELDEIGDPRDYGYEGDGHP